MQLLTSASTVALNTYESLATSEQKLPPVTGTVAPVAATPEALKTSPSQQPVAPSGANAEAEGYSEQRNRLNRDPFSQSTDKNSELSDEQAEQQLIRELAARDREVRQHELNHAAAGGKYAGAPTYELQRGPDGRLYAVGGEVSIDTSPVPNDPEATLEKAEVIIRAALAAAEPSAQDRAVAAKAAAMAAEARAEIAQMERQNGEMDETRTEADELREERRSKEFQDQVEDQQQASEKRGESLEDYNQKMLEVTEKLAEINQRLVDAGVFSKFFPTGSVFDQIV